MITQMERTAHVLAESILRERGVIVKVTSCPCRQYGRFATKNKRRRLFVNSAVKKAIYTQHHKLLRMTAARGLPALPQSEKVGRARARRWSSDIFTVLKNNPEGIG
jgi:hypothetical protein